jgi:HAD superfamily phosphoserine phosphatase-like hydrolase
VTVLLLDVCHTLYAANTTFDFLEQHLTNNHEYQRLAQRRQSLWHRVKSRLLNSSDDVRTDAIALLNGESQASLVEAARDYVMTAPTIAATHAYLKQQQAVGASVYLISSSLDCIVEQIAIALDADGWFGSELAFDGGICTGRLKTDLTAGKDQIISSRFSGQANIEFLTDNYSDANCIDLVDSFRPVFKRRDFRAQAFWLTRSTAEPLIYE